MTIFLLFPFSRLVHVWSGFASVGYIFRPYQVVRSRRLWRHHPDGIASTAACASHEGCRPTFRCPREARKQILMSTPTSTVTGCGSNSLPVRRP